MGPADRGPERDGHLRAAGVVYADEMHGRRLLSPRSMIGVRNVARLASGDGGDQL
jgi:hypothetical protein